MTSVNFEHNLSDYELEETLEKALHSVRLGIQRPKRKFRSPALEAMAVGSTMAFSSQMNSMVAGIEEVISG